MEIRDVVYRYRFVAGREDRTMDDPYPFRRSALVDMMYSRAISEDGITSWNMFVSFPIMVRIMEYVNRHTVDELNAPRAFNMDPRHEINEMLSSAEVERELARGGAELLWIDIGSFSMPDEVSQRRVETWRARWAGEAGVNRAYGEVQREALQQLGRAEANAEILASIVQELRSIPTERLHGHQLRNQILMQMPTILETLREQYRLGSQS